jgi:hypothetical protein
VATLVVPAALAGLVGLVVPAALVGLVGLVALAASVAGIARQPFPLAALAIDGSTTQHIVAELRIGIGRPRTGLEGRPAVTLLPIARQAPGNRWADKVAIWPATAPEEPARAIGPEQEAVAIGPEEQVVATGQVEAEGIASEAGISPAAVAGTGMPSGAVPGDTTDRTLAPAAAVAPPAWDREAGEVSVVVAAAGAVGRARKLRGQKSLGARNETKFY